MNTVSVGATAFALGCAERQLHHCSTIPQFRTLGLLIDSALAWSKLCLIWFLLPDPHFREDRGGQASQKWPEAALLSHLRGNLDKRRTFVRTWWGITVYSTRLELLHFSQQYILNSLKLRDGRQAVTTNGWSTRTVSSSIVRGRIQPFWERRCQAAWSDFQ